MVFFDMSDPVCGLV